MIKKKILITGSSSGLGLYLKKKYNAVGFNRYGLTYKGYFKKKWDLIIHCAWDPKNYEISDVGRYYKNTIEFSHLISKLSGKKFFMSTVAVYEKNKINDRNENSFIDQSKLSIYAKTKFISESFFRAKDDTILRLGSLAGHEMRDCTISKILSNKKCKINLSKDSKFSYVSYSEIGNFIDYVIINKKRGIFNFLRNDLKKLDFYCKYINAYNLKFGQIKFDVITAENKKIQNLGFFNSKLKKKSENVLKEYVKIKN